MARRWTPALVALLLPVAACAQAPDITGRWHSAAPEAMGPFFGTRSFEITPQRWEITFHAFADAGASQPLFTLRNAGVWVLGGPSPAVEGAWEGIFAQTQRLLVADSAAGVALFAQQGCTLTAGQALAVLQRPCGFVAPLMQAMGEYDLVALKNGQLFFGDRSGDLMKTRPSRLTPYPLVSSDVSERTPP